MNLVGAVVLLIKTYEGEADGSLVFAPCGASLPVDVGQPCRKCIASPINFEEPDGGWRLVNSRKFNPTLST
jgi:hypothetical protein